MDNLLAVNWDRFRMICMQLAAFYLLYFSDFDTASALVHGPLKADTIAEKMAIYCGLPHIPSM